MDPGMMQQEQAPEPELGAQEVIIELLTELVQQGRDKRAESVMAPPMEEPPPPEAADAEMAELEQMMSAPEGGEEMAGEPCPKCGKTPCEC